MTGLTKQEIIDICWRRVRKQGVHRKQVQEILEEAFWQVGTAAKKRKRFCWPGFGTFTPVWRKARRGRNPQNGKRILIPPGWNLRFRISEDLDLRLNPKKWPKRSRFKPDRDDQGSSDVS